MTGSGDYSASELQQALVQAIHSTGITQVELADRSGYNRSYINELMCFRHAGNINTWNDLLSVARVRMIGEHKIGP